MEENCRESQDSDRLQYSVAKLAVGESSKRHPNIGEACIGGEGGKEMMECCWEGEEVGTQHGLRQGVKRKAGTGRGKECAKRMNEIPQNTESEMHCG